MRRSIISFALQLWLSDASGSELERMDMGTSPPRSLDMWQEQRLKSFWLDVFVWMPDL